MTPVASAWSTSPARDVKTPQLVDLERSQRDSRRRTPSSHNESSSTSRGVRGLGDHARPQDADRRGDRLLSLPRVTIAAAGALADRRVWVQPAPTQRPRRRLAHSPTGLRDADADSRSRCGRDSAGSGRLCGLRWNVSQAVVSPGSRHLGGWSCGWGPEVVALVEIVDQPEMSRLPRQQLAGQRARRRAVETEEPGQPREMLARVLG